MKKTTKIILKSVSMIIVFLVLVFALLVAGVQLFGLKVYTVLSPSMEPEYKTGAIIYVKQVEPSELKTGDVITYLVSDDTTVTHRIVGIEKEDGIIYFTTKGDANKSVDNGRVHMNNVLGKPIFKIPYLGYAASFVTTPPGMYLGIAGGIILTVFVFMIDFITGEEPDKNKKGEKKNEENEDSTAVH